MKISPLTSWLGFLNVPKYLGAGATAVVSGPAGAGAGVVTTSMVQIRKLIHIRLEQCKIKYKIR